MTVNEEKKIVKGTLAFGMMSMLIGILLPILAVIIPWRPESEQLNTWFQRSGSVMVVVAVWAQVKLPGIYHMLNPTGLITEDGVTLRNEFGLFYSIIIWVVAIVAVAGTIIWGYGDLLIGNT